MTFYDIYSSSTEVLFLLERVSRPQSKSILKFWIASMMRPVRICNYNTIHCCDSSYTSERELLHHLYVFLKYPRVGLVKIAQTLEIRVGILSRHLRILHIHWEACTDILKTCADTWNHEHSISISSPLLFTTEFIFGYDVTYNANIKIAWVSSYFWQ